MSMVVWERNYKLPHEESNFRCPWNMKWVINKLAPGATPTWINLHTVSLCLEYEFWLLWRIGELRVKMSLHVLFVLWTDPVFTNTNPSVHLNRRQSERPKLKVNVNSTFQLSSFLPSRFEKWIDWSWELWETDFSDFEFNWDEQDQQRKPENQRIDIFWEKQSVHHIRPGANTPQTLVFIPNWNQGVLSQKEVEASQMTKVKDSQILTRDQ